MPIIKSAKKAARQSLKRTTKNERIKASIKNALKTFKKSPTAEKASRVQSEYDKAVKKGLMKKNTASRRKAAIAKLAKSANVKITTITKKSPSTKQPTAPTPAKKPATTTTTKKPTTKPATKKSTPTAKKPATKK